MRSLKDGLILADKLRHAGRLADAKRELSELLQADPKFVGAIHLSALVEVAEGRLDAAIEKLNRALRLGSRSVPVLVDLCLLHLKQKNWDMAIAWASFAKDFLCTREHLVFHILGEARRARYEFTQAIVEYETGLRLKPGFGPSLMGLASCKLNLGQTAEAAQVYNHLVAEHPHNLDYLYALLQLPSHLIEGDPVKHVGELMKQPQSTPSAKLDFCQASALHKAGRFGEAWAQFVNSNSRIFSGVAQDWERQKKADEELLKWVKTQPPFTALPANASSPEFVFILGPSRSGKSTAEQFLFGADRVVPLFEAAVLDEAVIMTLQAHGLPTERRLKSLPRELYAVFVENLRAIVAGRDDRRQVMFSLTHPGYVYDVPYLAALLPSCRFVFLNRNKDDLAFKMFTKLFTDGHLYSYSLKAIYDYIKWYSDFTTALRERLGQRALSLDYEALVSGKQEGISSLQAFLKISLDIAARSHTGDVGCSEPYRDMMISHLAAERAALSGNREMR